MAVPVPPIMRPTIWKIRATPNDVPPIDFKIAISLVLSMTIMVSAATMLNAATTMMIVMKTISATFCSVRAVNRLSLSSRQSITT